MRRKDWHAHPADPEPGRLAFWAVAIAGGVIGAVAFWVIIVLAIALLGPS